jgi:hypothetical protein
MIKNVCAHMVSVRAHTYIAHRKSTDYMITKNMKVF